MTNLHIFWAYGVGIPTCWCYNLSLGLATKARGCKVTGQEGGPGVMLHALGSVRKCEGIDSHTPKVTPTLRVGTPVVS
jgi:hypothetical protein